MTTPLDPPPLPPRLEASRHLPLVGRRLELETLERLWSEVEEGRRQLVFVGGEPGAGKTRLMAEVAGALYDHGTVVLVGSSDREASVPYRPFAEMLDHLFGTAPPGSLAGPLATGGRELRRLSAQVARHRPDLARDDPRAGDVRRDLFDAVAQLLRTVGEQRPVALLLDDLHWAQPPTLALLEHVVQACAATRLLVLATFRTTAPDRSDALTARVAELHRLEGVRRLDLGGLDTEAIAEYLSLRTGLSASEARPPAALLRDRTGGNPFFLRELWADLERHGGVAALRSSRPVPASIGDTLAARLAGLGDEVRGVIELAAVLGDTFDLAALTAASAVDPSATLACVDSAVSVGLIEPVDTGGHWSFVHSLARQAVLEAMPHARRTLLHAQAGEALERHRIGHRIRRRDLKPRNARLRLGKRQARPDPEGSRGEVRRRDHALRTIAAGDHQRRIRPKRGGAQLPAQPIGRPGRQVERDDPAHRRPPLPKLHSRRRGSARAPRSNTAARCLGPAAAMTAPRRSASAYSQHSAA